MVTPQLLDYINKQLSIGVSTDAIMASLQASNWSMNDINTAFNQLQASTSQIPIETKQSNKKHLWIDYILIFLSIIQGISNFIGKIGLLQIIGAIYYFITAFALFKKPKVGYIMFVAAIVLFIFAFIIYRYTSLY